MTLSEQVLVGIGPGMMLWGAMMICASALQGVLRRERREIHGATTRKRQS